MLQVGQKRIGWSWFVGILFAAALLLASAPPVFAAPGDLDASFGTNGVAASSTIATFYSAAVQPDGKIVAAGGGGCGPTFCGSSVPFLARFNADGSLDSTFGSGGTVPVADYDVRINLPLAVQNDGKPLTVTPFLTRYSASGAFDTIFTNNAPVSGEISTAAIALQPDGKIVLALDRFLQRYNSDGTYDLSFGTNGIIDTGQPYRSIVMHGDGKISGVACPFGGAIITQRNSDGSLDPSFDGDGSTFIPDTAAPCSLSLQADGKTVLVSNNAPQIEIRRVNIDGSLDTGFGIAGLATASGFAEAGAVQPDGKILAAGSVANTLNSILVARFNADGTPDAQFGTGGTVLTGGSQIFAQGHGITLQPDGKIVIAGTWFDYTNPVGGAALLRYNSPAVAPTPVGSSVFVAFPSGITLTFTSVTSAGLTSIDTAATGPTPPAGFQLGNSPSYYDIQTTAAYTGPITECFPYTLAAFPDPAQARLFHYEAGAWTDVTTSNDTTNLIICGQTSSLSPFAIFRKINDPAALINNLIALVKSLNVKQGIQNSLDAKLQAAQSALTAAKAKDKPQACSQMASFINEVQAQTGKALTGEQAAQLVASANQIKTSLGCQ